MNKSSTLRSWYKYEDDIINLVKFMKGNTNSVLMNFQVAASILFYVDVKYVSICHINLCNDNEVIDLTGHNRPPVIDQLQDATSSLSSSKTLSSFRIPHHAPGRLFEGVACPSASGRDPTRAKDQNLQLRNR